MKNDVDEIRQRFKKVERLLKAKTWFKTGKWIVSIHTFPNDLKPDGVTFQVFRKHWWNEERQGIHIESFLSLNPKKQKTYVTLHLLHSKVIPGTNLKREVLSRSFVDAIYDDVKEWKGYKFRAGKYGTQPFTKILDGAKATFEHELTEEVSRMCTKLGPILESCIEEIL